MVLPGHKHAVLCGTAVNIEATCVQVPTLHTCVNNKPCAACPAPYMAPPQAAAAACIPVWQEGQCRVGCLITGAPGSARCARTALITKQQRLLRRRTVVQAFSFTMACLQLACQHKAPAVCCLVLENTLMCDPQGITDNLTEGKVKGRGCCNCVPWWSLQHLHCSAMKGGFGTVPVHKKGAVLQ